MDNHLLSHAIAIATEAHKGQKDKYGQEYLHHPIRVMNMGRNLKRKDCRYSTRRCRRYGMDIRRPGKGRILCRNH